jgi:hypothetical protein
MGGRGCFYKKPSATAGLASFRSACQLRHWVRIFKPVERPPAWSLQEATGFVFAKTVGDCQIEIFAQFGGPSIGFVFSNSHGIRASVIKKGLDFFYRLPAFRR